MRRRCSTRRSSAWKRISPGRWLCDPTVGDELQGVYARLNDALVSLLLLRLALPDGMECRFGLGVGPVGIVRLGGR